MIEGRREFLKGVASTALGLASAACLPSREKPTESNVIFVVKKTADGVEIEPVGEAGEHAIDCEIGDEEETDLIGPPNISSLEPGAIIDERVRIEGSDEYFSRRFVVRGEAPIIDATFSLENFSFSDAIRSADLVPRVFSSHEMPLQRIVEAQSYLDRCWEFLKNNPKLRGPKLLELGFNSPDNFPVDVPDSADIFDLLKIYRRDDEAGRITYNTDPKPQTFNLGTINTPLRENKRWRLIANTTISYGVLHDSLHQEENGFVHYQDTDLQLALKILHEYIHYLQDRAIMAKLLRNNRIMTKVGEDPNELRAWIERQVILERDRVATTHPDLPLSKTKTIAFNETQANIPPQLLLKILRVANQTDRFPAAWDDDPYPIKPDSLQRVFDKVVLNSSPTANLNALNADWLMKHSNWR